MECQSVRGNQLWNERTQFIAAGDLTYDLARREST